ncbi:MAG: hypothetical protein KAU10_07745, partial [Dehalococcoidia bacterium]|nr:hypothetical protein [Dehalococcoidia bacterium]
FGSDTFAGWWSSSHKYFGHCNPFRYFVFDSRFEAILLPSTPYLAPYDVSSKSFGTVNSQLFYYERAE